VCQIIEGKVLIPYVRQYYNYPKSETDPGRDPGATGYSCEEITDIVTYAVGVMTGTRKRGHCLVIWLGVTYSAATGKRIIAIAGLTDGSSSGRILKYEVCKLRSGFESQQGQEFFLLYNVQTG
jgi:hypothetical protein